MLLPYRLAEIFPSAPSGAPHLNFQFSKTPPPHFGGTNSSPNFVADPNPYYLDLDIDCVSNLWDPSRVVRIDLLCRHFILVFLNEFMRVELSHFPSENLSKSPISGLCFSNILLKSADPFRGQQASENLLFLSAPPFVLPPGP